jgi:hypothetical protein
VSCFAYLLTSFFGRLLLLVAPPTPALLGALGRLMLHSLFSKFVPKHTEPTQQPGVVDNTFSRLWYAPLVVALLTSTFVIKFFVNIDGLVLGWSLVTFTLFFMFIFTLFFCFNSYYHWWGFSRGLGSVVEGTAPSRFFFMAGVVGTYALTLPLFFVKFSKATLVVCINIQHALFSWVVSVVAPTIVMGFAGLFFIYIFSWVLLWRRQDPTSLIVVGFTLTLGVMLAQLGLALFSVIGSWGHYTPHWYSHTVVDPQCAGAVDLYTFTLALVSFMVAAMAFSW